jgi:predicted metal-binding membrane protein
LIASRAIEAMVRRDWLIVIGGLAIVVAIAWTYILSGAGMGMSAFDMTLPPAVSTGSGITMATSALPPMGWTVGTATLMVFMWWIMMIAMMLPGEAPIFLLFATVNRKGAERGNPYVPTGVFAAGYPPKWGAFSVVATGLTVGAREDGAAVLRRRDEPLLDRGPRTVRAAGKDHPDGALARTCDRWRIDRLGLLYNRASAVKET